MTALAAAPRPETIPQLGLATLGLLAVVAIAVGVQTTSAVNTDVSWLLTLGERWAAGDRPYVDFIEVNPPASILLYMPAVLAARWLGVAPETATLALVLAAALASAALSIHIAAAADLVPRASAPLLRILLSVVLTVLPTGDFAEREHIATIAVLPLLAAIAARAAGRSPALVPALLAGLAGAAAMTIKPMFGLALIGPIGLMLARRGLRSTIASPELHVAWAVPALYGAMVPFAFPAFTTDVLHRVLVAYLPFRQPWTVFVLQPTTFVAFGFGALWLLATERTARGLWAEVLLLAALGFEGAFLLQGKAWVYQALPAVSLAAAALLIDLVRTGPALLMTGRRRAVVASAVLLGVLSAAAFASHPTMGAAIPGLEPAIVAAKPHPTMLALSSDIAVGHPLVRDIGGRWVGTFPSQWISRNAEKLRAEGISPEKAEELDHLSHQEQATVAHDLAAKRPDVVLVDGARGERYVADHPAIAAEMNAYEKRGTFGPIAVWSRKGEVPTANASHSEAVTSDDVL